MIGTLTYNKSAISGFVERIATADFRAQETFRGFIQHELLGHSGRLTIALNRSAMRCLPIVQP